MEYGIKPILITTVVIKKCNHYNTRLTSGRITVRFRKRSEHDESTQRALDLFECAFIASVRFNECTTALRKR
jgi:hypothetical protein